MNIAERPNKSNTKVFYYEEWGRGAGDRATLNIFTYINPKNQLEKNRNAETLKILEVEDYLRLLKTPCLNLEVSKKISVLSQRSHQFFCKLNFNLNFTNPKSP